MKLSVPIYRQYPTVKTFRTIGSSTNTATGPFSDSTQGTETQSLPLHRIGSPPYDCRRNTDGNDGGASGGRPGGIPLEQTMVGRSSPALQRRSPLHHSVRYDNDTNDDTNRSCTIQQYRSYTMSSRTERAPQVAIFALGSIALTAKAGQYAMQAYNEYTKSQPAPPTDTEQHKQDTSDDHNKSTKDTSSSNTGGSRDNIFQKYFNLGVGSKYYDGGFEDKMTRREAALILGVRESSTHKRIKEAHRKLLILNHPDTGGSTYLSGKLNEAKDLLLKGRKRPVQ